MKIKTYYYYESTDKEKVFNDLKEARISLRMLARYVGVSVTHLSNILNGRRPVNDYYHNLFQSIKELNKNEVYNTKK